MRFNAIGALFAALLALTTSPPTLASGVRLSLLSGADYGFVVSKIAYTESPLGFLAHLEYMSNANLTWGLEHSRTVRISPFRSGIGFTGLTARWFPFAPFPSTLPSDSEEWVAEDSYAERAIALFLGPSLGWASASGTRTVGRNEQEIKGNGLYVGLRLGFEYPMMRGSAIRMETGARYSIVGSASMQGDAFALLGFAANLF